MWIVGPNVDVISGGMFVIDAAWRPEFIVSDWVLFAGSYLSSTQGITVTCRPNRFISNKRKQWKSKQGAEERKSNKVEVLLDALSSSPLSATEETTLYDDNIITSVPPVNACSIRSICYHGGKCRPAFNSASAFLCQCSPAFFGARCGQRIMCGELPTTDDNIKVVSQTGRGFLDVTMYRCVGNQRMVGPAGIICQMNSTWSEPPSCLPGAHRITPEEQLTR